MKSQLKKNEKIEIYYYLFNELDIDSPIHILGVPDLHFHLDISYAYGRKRVHVRATRFILNCQLSL